jgi:hypothetical protein
MRLAENLIEEAPSPYKKSIQHGEDSEVAEKKCSPKPLPFAEVNFKDNGLEIFEPNPKLRA